MNGLAKCGIAIDTNIFLHLFNPLHNAHGHIDELLERLMLDQVCLCEDDHKTIQTEYDEKLSRLVQSENEGNQTHILRYWILQSKRTVVEVDKKGQIMGHVRRIIRENNEPADRMFVAVALIWGVVLVTNDLIHIVHGPANQRRTTLPRRDRLLSDTKKIRQGNADILTTDEARNAL